MVLERPERIRGATDMETGMLLIDRHGMPPGRIDEHEPMMAERPGDPTSPVWTRCDVELANGARLTGGLRLSPPQKRPGEPPVVRATGLMAIVRGRSVDLMCGSERAAAGLVGWETLPVRVRLQDAPPYQVEGMSEVGPRAPLRAREWSRPLDPRDLANELQRLSPRGW